jgi:transposase
MIALTGTTRIFLYRGATDMRKGFDGLAGMVREHFAEDIFCGALFVFVNRRRNYVKILYWDRDGFAVWAKRLESGTFKLPVADSDGLELSAGELSMLLEGMTPVRITPRYRRPAVAGA